MTKTSTRPMIRIGQYQADQLTNAERQAAAAQKAADRAALLVQLGITEEQAKLLVG